MSSRLQKINSEYSRKLIEIENNEKIKKDVISSLVAIKSSLSEETVNTVNSYQPGLLDLLDFDNLSKDGKFDKSSIEVSQLKENLKYVLDTLLTNMERELL